MVFGCLLEVADNRAMEIADLGLVNADLGPLCEHLVTERYLVFIVLPMVVGGLWWSPTISVVGGRQPVLASV